MRMANTRRGVTLVTALAFTVYGGAALAADDAEIEARLAQLSELVAALQREVADLKAHQTDRLAASEPVASLTPNEPTPGTTRGIPDQLTFSGYGELDYARPTNDPSATTADARRAVLGMTYRFDDKTRIVSEFEFEHAITSADDDGETAVEMLYIERELRDSLYAKGGLFLIPSGMLNENHEPTRYYGVFRNRVETAIIPTTWREGGVLLQGQTGFGLRWDVGVTTGFNLSKWDFSSEEGRESPLGSIHQEMSFAQASDLAGVVALNYTGVPGLLLGASVFSGDSAQGQPGLHDNRITLWETHARWTPGRWDLAALYAHGEIDDTADVNRLYVGSPTLIPQTFFGWYGQAAFRLWDRDTASLYPFVRFERVNTASNYATIAPGLTPPDAPDQDILVSGVNFNFANGVVLKADYMHFYNNDDGTEPGNQFDLGIGYQF
jgi:hypothetical protein